MRLAVAHRRANAACRIASRAIGLALLPLCLACRAPLAKPVAAAPPRPEQSETETARPQPPAFPQTTASRQPPPASPRPSPEAPQTEPIVRVEHRAPPMITPPAGTKAGSARPQAGGYSLDGAPGVPSLSERLQIPPEFPGANAPPLSLPPRDPDHPEKTYPIIDELFPDLPPVWPLSFPTPTPQRPALSLEQLQQFALENNPELVQARADITSMFGDAVQAGTHPNPTVGYEADTVGSSKTRNYQGVFFTQWIKTAGKLSLARAIKNYDVMNAQLALRRTRVSVLARIKASYFAVLVAQENVVVMSALVRFTDEVYRIQTEKLKATFAAAFEPAQLRGLADQAKILQVDAQNRYITAWKQLAAEMGLPQMPPAPLAGRADMPVPVVTYEGALNRVLSLHPDVLIGLNMEKQARVALRLAELTPVPDVYLYGTFQKDFTTPNYLNTSYNLQLGVPLPLWDRNRGGIISSQGDLLRASQQMRLARNQLTAQLADAYGRYSTSRITLEMYRDHILRDYARAYRGVYERHQQQPADVGFEGIIVAQGYLADAIAKYIAALNAQWTAVADLANLMQVEEFDALSEAGSGALGTQSDPGRTGPAEPPRSLPLPAPPREEGRP